jgi:hypothetical protein
VNQHIKVYYIQAKRTISMSMANQNGVDMSQSILGKPLDCSRLEILAHINDNGPEQPSLLNRAKRRAARTYLFFPSFPSMRITADVFLLMFFLPSALRVERHVLQGASVLGAVRQETLGKLPDVPVPRKMNSIPGATCTKCEVCEVLSGITGEVGW